MSHSCYLLRSSISSRTYFGYTTNIHRRLRQHNGEIKGGAKKTQRGRPWVLMAHITGFPNQHEALSFEWHIHHKRGWSQGSRLKEIDRLMREFKEKRSINLTINFPDLKL